MRYTVSGASLLPILRRALSYLHQLCPLRLERPTLELAIDACLSASNFGDKNWKTVAVQYAEIMAAMTDCVVIKGRVRLRKAALARLYNAEDIPDVHEIEIPRINNRSNADFGRLVLLQARLQMEKSKPSKTIREILNQFRGFTPESDMEKSVQLEINFLQAKLHRYDGNFSLASDMLVDFMENQTARINMFIIHYCEIQCEVGSPSRAVEALEYEYRELLKKEDGQSGTGRRLRLALGGAYIMTALLRRSFKCNFLEKAKSLFLSVQWVAAPSIVTKQNYYVAKASLGMIHLLKSEWKESMKHWDAALVAARDCFPDPGHSEMVTQYAQCVISHRLGQYSEAQRQGAAAREIFQRCGRQYYFVGQGTAWLDKLDELATENGTTPIATRGSQHGSINAMPIRMSG